MRSDYNAITCDNIRRRGEDFADIGSFLAEKLYGDRSHFIYELLQNAEDALELRWQKEQGIKLPGDVKFKLYKDHLEVSHYGKLFDEPDVRGICDILRGTKNERLDQIGTFGIGFKSVYAFTASPEIHSGDEHFVIEQYIRPREVFPRKLDDPRQTLFYFPFDHPKFGSEAAFALIQSKLRSLGPRSLLFLHHVKTLQWFIDDVGDGFYMREAHPSDKGGSLVQIVGEGTDQEDVEEDWLLIERGVQHPTRSEKLPVKIAYSLERSPGGDSIQPLSRSPLTVYFPTAKETGLSFLIHGPFASTPARDNIQSDSEWNDLLLSELACLVADSLVVCKLHGFLNADFLSCLPIDDEMFPLGSTFRPIYDAVLDAVIEQPLIPTDDGSHVPATSAVLGRSQDLRDLLPPRMLLELFGSHSIRGSWVDGAVTENRPPKVWHYLRDECEVPVVDGETFARMLTLPFLEKRDEAWMVRFYSFLTGQEALWRPKGVSNLPEGLLRKKPVIRCEDEQHRAPFDEFGRPIVFLPVDSDSDCHVVNRAIYRHDKAAEFFHRLRLVPPDICTKVLNDVLPFYKDSRIEDPNHPANVAIIRNAMRLKDSPRYAEMVRALKDTTWVLARNAATGEEHYDKPANLYFALPNLQLFFEGNKTVSFLAEQDEDVDWQMLGVRSQPVINCLGLSARSLGYVILSSSHGWHKRGFDGFDPGTSIVGLEHALNTITLEKAAYIWNELVPPLTRFLHGRYQTATHQSYDNATTQEQDSDLCKMLKTHAWIPVDDNGFKMPPQCCMAEIAGNLQRNDTLARLLGVHPDPLDVAQGLLENQRALITRAGFSPEVAALLVLNRDAISPKIISEILASHAAEDTANPAFPEHPVPDPDRRATGVRNRTRRADPKTYDKRKRSVRTSTPSVSPRLWLREMYTNRQGVTVCQLCCKAMPFKVPTTGEYYFEAVQVADNFAREDHCLYLALCPLCAARYSVLVKKDDERLSQFIWDIERADGGNLIVPLQLDGSATSVRFVESHILDLKTALNECLS